MYKMILKTYSILYSVVYCVQYNCFSGVPAAKQARVATPAPDLDSILLSEAQVTNPEMLFKVNHTAKYVVS